MSDANYTFGPNGVLSSEIEFTARNGGEDLISVVLRLGDKEQFSPDFLWTLGESLTLNVNGKEIKHNQGDQIGDNPLSFPFDVRVAREEISVDKPLRVELKLKGQAIGSWDIREGGSIDVVDAPVVSALTLRQLDQAMSPVELQRIPVVGSNSIYTEFAGALSNTQMAALTDAKEVKLPLDRTVSDVEISRVIAAREKTLKNPEVFVKALQEIAEQAKRNGIKSLHLATTLVWEPEILAAIHEVAPQLGVQVSFSPAIDKSPQDPARKEDYIKTRLPELLKSPYVTGLSLNGADVYHAGGLQPHIEAYRQATVESQKPITLAINAGERNFHASNIDTLTDIILRAAAGDTPFNVQIVGGLFGANPDKMAKLQGALEQKGGSLQFAIDPAYYLTTGESPAAIDTAISKLSGAGVKVTYCSKASGMTGYAWGEDSQLAEANLRQFVTTATPRLIQNEGFDPRELRFEDKSVYYAQQEQARLDEIARKLDLYMRDDNGVPIPRGFPEKADCPAPL